MFAIVCIKYSQAALTCDMNMISTQLEHPKNTFSFHTTCLNRLDRRQNVSYWHLETCMPCTLLSWFVGVCVCVCVCACLYVRVCMSYCFYGMCTNRMVQFLALLGRMLELLMRNVVSKQSKAPTNASQMTGSDWIDWLIYIISIQALQWLTLYKW